MKIDEQNKNNKPDLVARAIAYLKSEFLSPNFGDLFDKVRSGVILKLCETYLGKRLAYRSVGSEIEMAEQRFDIAYNLCRDGLEAKRQYDLFGV